jgi:hypothetical protein
MDNECNIDIEALKVNLSAKAKKNPANSEITTAEKPTPEKVPVNSKKPAKAKKNSTIPKAAMPEEIHVISEATKAEKVPVIHDAAMPEETHVIPEATKAEKVHVISEARKAEKVHVIPEATKAEKVPMIHETTEATYAKKVGGEWTEVSKQTPKKKSPIEPQIASAFIQYLHETTEVGKTNCLATNKFGLVNWLNGFLTFLAENNPDLVPKISDIVGGVPAWINTWANFPKDLEEACKIPNEVLGKNKLVFVKNKNTSGPSVGMFLFGIDAPVFQTYWPQKCWTFQANTDPEYHIEPAIK